jgi:hypothetical protein
MAIPSPGRTPAVAYAHGQFTRWQVTDLSFDPRDSDDGNSMAIRTALLAVDDPARRKQEGGRYTHGGDWDESSVELDGQAMRIVFHRPGIGSAKRPHHGRWGLIATCRLVDCRIVWPLA